jgi:hypothetical protein
MRPSKSPQIISDRIDESGTEIRFVRIRVGQNTRRIDLDLNAEIEKALSLRQGLLLRLHRDDRDLILWFPCAPFLAQFDQRGRVTLNPKSTTYELCDAEEVTRLGVITDCAAGYDLCVTVIIVAEQLEKFEDEVQALSDLIHPPLLKSDWFRARSPHDFWHYLIHGEVFDPRQSRPGGGRFRCQQCGFSWWSYFQRMHDQTGLGICRFLAREVAWSVRADLRRNGEWTHGFWRDPPETHLRFVLDGIHLLISEGEISGEFEWIIDAEEVMESVILRFTDSLDDDKIWFLHDSLELDAAAPKTRSRLLGAAVGNTLCLNTHVQALTVLNRLRRRRSSEREPLFEKAYRRGLAALERILTISIAEPLYRLLGRLVMPAVTAKNQPGVSARLRRVFLLRLFQFDGYFC